MIYVENSPNNTGVYIFGDYLDFSKLYMSLHQVVGDEGEFSSLEAARIRVLGICYDLRHSILGDREVEFVENGMDDAKMRELSVISSTKNVYYKIDVFWTEILFVTMVLNDFLKLYTRKKSKRCYECFFDKKTVWDENIAMARLFQSAVAECIKKTLTPQTAVRVLNTMSENYDPFHSYAAQYIDILNCKFLDIPSEKRLKSISPFVKQILKLSGDYYDLKEDIEEEALRCNCSPVDVKLSIDYPVNIKW